MNIVDAILIGIVVFFFIIGYIRGLLRQVIGFASFFIAAVAAYVYYRNNGSVLGVTLIFFLTNLGLSILFWVLGKLLHRKKAKLSVVSRIAGGAIGGFAGIIFVLIAVVFLHLLSGAIAASNPAIVERLEASFFYTRYKAISMASEVPLITDIYRLGELFKGTIEGIVLDPQTLKELGDNPSIQAALEDKQLVESIKQKDYARIISNPNFLKILNDRVLVKQLVAIGLKGSSPVAPENPQGWLEALKPKHTGSRLEGIAYYKGSPGVIINGEIYQLGNEVYGGKIAEITEHTMTLEFPDKRKKYSIGEVVP